MKRDITVLDHKGTLGNIVVTIRNGDRGGLERDSRMTVEERVTLTFKVGSIVYEVDSPLKYETYLTSHFKAAVEDHKVLSRFLGLDSEAFEQGRMDYWNLKGFTLQPLGDGLFKLAIRAEEFLER